MVARNVSCLLSSRATPNLSESFEFGSTAFFQRLQQRRDFFFSIMIVTLLHVVATVPCSPCACFPSQPRHNCTTVTCSIFSCRSLQGTVRSYCVDQMFGASTSDSRMRQPEKVYDILNNVERGRRVTAQAPCPCRPTPMVARKAKDTSNGNPKSKERRKQLLPDVSKSCLNQGHCEEGSL